MSVRNGLHVNYFITISEASVTRLVSVVSV